MMHTAERESNRSQEQSSYPILFDIHMTPEVEDLEPIAFSPFELPKRIETYFSQATDRAYAFNQFLTGQPLLKYLLQIPFYFNHLCRLWVGGHFEFDPILTLTQMHHQLIVSIQEQSSTLIDISSGRKERLLLAQLAFAATKAGYHSFSAEFMRESLALSEDNLNLLRHSSLLRTTEAEETEYAFLHPMLQDYFTGLYCAYALIKGLVGGNSVRYESVSGQIQAHRYDPRWQLILRFIAGNLEGEVKALQRFYTLVLAQQPRDVLQSDRLPLLIHCMQESRGNIKAYVPDSKRVREQIVAWAIVKLKSYDRDAFTEACLSAPSVMQIIYSAGLEKELELALSAPHRSKFERSEAIHVYEQLWPLLADKSKITDWLLRALNDADALFKVQAIKILATLPDKSEAVIDKVLNAARDRQHRVRYAAVEALARLEHPSGKVINALITALRDTDPFVLQAATRALGNLAKQEGKIIDWLLAIAESEDEKAAQQAISALDRVTLSEEVKKRLSIILEQPTKAKALAAAKVLGLNNAAVLERLFVLLAGDQVNKEEERIRAEVIQLLGQQLNVDNRVGDALVTLVNDPNELGLIKTKAITTLSNLEHPSEAVINALLLAGSDDDYEISNQAVATLILLAKKSQDVLHSLLQALGAEHEAPSLKREILKILQAVGQRSDAISQVLLKLLKANLYFQEKVIATLGALALNDESVTKELLPALHDSMPSIRIQVLEVLSQLDNADTQVVEALLQALNDPHPTVKCKAINALGNLGKGHETVVLNALCALWDQVHESTNWKDKDVQIATLAAFAQLGTHSEPVLKLLLAAVNNPRSQVHEEAIKALGALARTDEPVLDTLFAALNDEGLYLCSQAIAALEHLGACTPKVADALVSFLNHTRGNYAKNPRSAKTDERSRAVRLLGSSVDHAYVLPGLMDVALQDSDYAVRAVAADVLINFAQNGELALLQLLDHFQDPVLKEKVMDKLGSRELLVYLFHKTPLASKDYTCIAQGLLKKHWGQGTTHSSLHFSRGKFFWYEHEVLQEVDVPDPLKAEQLIQVLPQMMQDKYGLPIQGLRTPGDTPLHQAAEEGNLSLAQRFLNDWPQYLDSRDNRDHKTPLISAVAAHQTQIVGYLLQQGADINLSTLGGKTAIDYACAWEQDSARMQLTTGLLMLRRPWQRFEFDQFLAGFALDSLDWQDKKAIALCLDQVLASLLGLDAACVTRLWQQSRQLYFDTLKLQATSAIEPSSFLALHIRYLLELILGLKAGVLRPEADLGIDSIALIAGLKSEILLSLEALRQMNTQEMVRAHFEQLAQGSLWQLINSIKTLPIGAEYLLAAGSPQCFMGIAFYRAGDNEWQVRLDDVYQQSRAAVGLLTPKETEISAMMLGHLKQEDFAGKELQTWLQNLLLNRGSPNFDYLYQHLCREIPATAPSDWPKMRLYDQTHERYASFSMGWRCRLWRDYCQAQAEPLYQWLAEGSAVRWEAMEETDEHLSSTPFGDYRGNDAYQSPQVSL